MPAATALEPPGRWGRFTPDAIVTARQNLPDRRRRARGVGEMSRRGRVPRARGAAGGIIRIRSSISGPSRMARSCPAPAAAGRITSGGDSCRRTLARSVGGRASWSTGRIGVPAGCPAPRGSSSRGAAPARAAASWFIRRPSRHQAASKRADRGSWVNCRGFAAFHPPALSNAGPFGPRRARCGTV